MFDDREWAFLEAFNRSLDPIFGTTPDPVECPKPNPVKHGAVMDWRENVVFVNFERKV